MCNLESYFVFVKNLRIKAWREVAEILAESCVEAFVWLRFVFCFAESVHVAQAVMFLYAACASDQ